MYGGIQITELFLKKGEHFSQEKASLNSVKTNSSGLAVSVLPVCGNGDNRTLILKVIAANDFP
jgi:hypothetical protein